MKRWLIILTILLLACCSLFVYAVYSYYAPPKERQPYIIPHHTDDTLRIAYIGDSWAAMHKGHDCIIPQILSDSIHRPVKLSSFGLHGKTSKEIYQCLFDNQQMHEFMMQGFDYCFISAGINDTYKKMGAKYYKTSMNCIIRFMLANHIRPVILDIPDYDIVQAYKRQNKSRQLLRKISMQVTGASLDCKQEFRNSLKNLVSEKYLHQATILYYHEWNNKYHQDLQSYYLSDGMHLNTVGYDRLDRYIANYIIQQICMNDSIRVK